MGCPAEVVIGDSLTFSVCTHDSETGRLTNADSVPTYNIYEDNSGSAMVSGGSMTRKDALGTTGFYTATINCTAANGYENGKTYTIYIAATVDGDTGGITYAFKATSASLGTGARTVTVTVNDGTNVLEAARVRFTIAGATYGLGSTNSSGVVVFNLDDATYTVAISKVGYTYSGTTLVVDSDETATYSMTAQSITTPSDPSLCTVQFRVKLSNAAVEGAVCKARLLGINQASDGTILSNEESSDTTDSEGVAELALVRKDQITRGSGRYKIEVTYEGKTIAAVETTVPNQSAALFEDMLP